MSTTLKNKIKIGFGANNCDLFIVHFTHFISTDKNSQTM